MVEDMAEEGGSIVLLDMLKGCQNMQASVCKRNPRTGQNRSPFLLRKRSAGISHTPKPAALGRRPLPAVSVSISTSHVAICSAGNTQMGCIHMRIDYNTTSSYSAINRTIRSPCHHPTPPTQPWTLVSFSHPITDPVESTDLFFLLLFYLGLRSSSRSGTTSGGRSSSSSSSTSS